MLLGVRERTGAALLVIEHDMPMITSISDEIIALELGSVITRDHPDAVLRHPRVIASYLGTSGEDVAATATSDGGSAAKPTLSARKARPTVQERAVRR